MSTLNLRLSPALKSEAAAYAESLGISCNALVAVALRDYLDARKSTRSQPADPEAGLTRTERAAKVEEGRLLDGPTPNRSPEAGQKVVQLAGKVGRNEPCPCGSGKKWKQCHGGAV